MKWGAVFSYRASVRANEGPHRACRDCVAGRHARPCEILRQFAVDMARMVARMFTCPGDVAQLGERLGRIEEVEGSIPFVSTTG